MLKGFLAICFSMLVVVGISGCSNEGPYAHIPIESADSEVEEALDITPSIDPGDSIAEPGASTGKSSASHGSVPPGKEADAGAEEKKRRDFETERRKSMAFGNEESRRRDQQQDHDIQDLRNRLIADSEQRLKQDQEREKQQREQQELQNARDRQQPEPDQDSDQNQNN